MVSPERAVFDPTADRRADDGIFRARAAGAAYGVARKLLRAEQRKNGQGRLITGCCNWERWHDDLMAMPIHP